MDSVEKKARFIIAGFSSREMSSFGQELLKDIKARIARGVDVNDQPAIPLSSKYATWKARNAPPAIRNLKVTGATIAALRVMNVQDNSVQIGFSNPKAARIGAENSNKSKQIGASEKDLKTVRESMKIAWYHPIFKGLA